jgi:hypothetical protein
MLGCPATGRAALEDGGDLPEPEHVHPRGGELDRERQSVHPPRDLRREPDLLGVRFESWTRRTRTLEEEVNSRRRPLSLSGPASTSGATGKRASLAR